jgi:NAD(P)H dehydrogenase (quinone)
LFSIPSSLFNGGFMKLLVLYYSSYGHIFQMAEAVAQGAREVAGTEVTLRVVPETLPNDVLEKMGITEAKKHFRQDPVATVNELADYDAVIFGTPTRFGNMAGQMKSFIDGAGSLWLGNKLVGKVSSVFTSSATQHGGQESTILTFIPPLLHLGFIYVGLPYSYQGQMGLEEIKGNSPYGASTIAGGAGERQPSESDLAGARFQGKHVATIASKLSR